MVLMADDSLPDYKALWKQETELRRQETEQAEESRRQAEEGTRRTTFEEFIRACHNFLSLQVEQLYNSVRKFLHASEEDAPRLFSSPAARSEKDLETYEPLAVEDNVRYVIAELCKIPDAREEFKLEDGFQFDNHANALPDVESDKADVNDQSSVRLPVPDKFFYRVKGDTNTLFTTAEYKPPHKLSVESLRAGQRPMDFYEKVVQLKLRYGAEQLTGSALVQQYNDMIRKGLEYYYITNGYGLGPAPTLYYCLCEPNREVGLADDQSLKQPRTSVSRILCLCLMSLRYIPGRRTLTMHGRRFLKTNDTKLHRARNLRFQSIWHLPFRSLHSLTTADPILGLRVTVGLRKRCTVQSPWIDQTQILTKRRLDGSGLSI
ncbi:hypothetical protein V1524DRAFT_443604 [Lipomyces starkeyi]